MKIIQKALFRRFIDLKTLFLCLFLAIFPFTMSSALDNSEKKQSDIIHILPILNLLLESESSAEPEGSVSFSCGWEVKILGNGCWDEINRVADNRIRRVTSPVRKGQFAARFEVRPGDDPLSTPGNPCIGCGERAEVADMTTAAGVEINETLASGTQFYAFSVMFDRNWKTPKPGTDGLWSHFFQLHGPDDLNTSAAFAMDSVLEKKNGEVTDGIMMILHSGDLDDENNSLQWQSFELTDSGLNKGHWIDFIIKIKFAADFTGSVDVWRRNHDADEFTQVLSTQQVYGGGVPTLQYRKGFQQGAVLEHYWKHGIYHPKQTQASGIVSILWLDGMSRGTSFDAVKHAAFP